MYFYKNGALFEQENCIENMGNYDVVVVGGGVAGVGAALAASKYGWKTLIIESTSALGGLATMGLVNIPLDFVSGLGVEMFERLEKIDGLWHRNSDPEKHKLVLDQMIKDYNCDVLLVTQVVDAVMNGNSIEGVVIQTKSGRKSIFAKRVIDASGDSDISFYAGAEVVSGRPEDGMSQACSLEFILGGVDWDKYLKSDIKKTDSRWVKTIADDLNSGVLPYEVDNHLNWITHIPGRPEHCGKDEVSICFAHSRNCYPLDTKDLTRMYIEGRDQANMLAKYIKSRFEGFENSYLISTGSLLGVRESRRIVGEYILTARDLASLQKHDDVICISIHGYDVHNYDGPGNIKWAEMDINGNKEYVICSASGFGTTTPPPHNKKVVTYRGETAEDATFEPGAYYDIPYRTLVPTKIDNLLAAGRNLSSDVNAQSGARLVMACFTMGEAAGTAMAISLKENQKPRDINVKKLQIELINNGVNIGQNLREISGISSSDFVDSYRNPEFSK